VLAQFSGEPHALLWTAGEAETYGAFGLVLVVLVGIDARTRLVCSAAAPSAYFMLTYALLWTAGKSEAQVHGVDIAAPHVGLATRARRNPRFTRAAASVTTANHTFQS